MYMLVAQSVYRLSYGFDGPGSKSGVDEIFLPISWRLCGPSAGMNIRGKSRPHRNSIPDPPASNSVTIPTEVPN
jgi:hypothetical protein